MLLNFARHVRLSRPNGEDHSGPGIEGLRPTRSGVFLLRDSCESDWVKDCLKSEAPVGSLAGETRAAISEMGAKLNSTSLNWLRR